MINTLQLKEVLNIPVTDSPLRYPGGKTQMKKFIVDILRTNSISDCYVEPFAGGAGVALYLLFNNYVNKIYINDIDPSIYSFWYSILNNTNEFIKKLESVPITIDEWNKQKYIQINSEDYNELELGFSTFFLNRTNISGIINGGPIGGKKQKGKYKLDCRFNKADLISKIKKISYYKDCIEVTNYDAEYFIENIIKKLNPSNTFIFLDPPYYKQGKKLYTNFYRHENHVSLQKKISSLKEYYWIVTYDLAEEIEEIYKGNRKKKYSLNYSANRFRKASELLFYSEKIILPDTDNIKFV